MTTPIPRRFADITPAWLTGRLRQADAVDTSAVTAIAIEPIGVGLGFLGELARLRLTYDLPEAGAPATLVGKLPTTDPGGRQVSKLFGFYERESRFYRELAHRVPLRVPRCYASLMDVEADDYLMLLEDLGALPMGDDATGCSAAEAEVAVRSIAALHAAWWNSQELARLDWMPEANAPVHQLAEPAYQGSLVPFLQMFGDHLTPKMRTITERLSTHVVDMLNALARPPVMIAHGDYRLDNLFFDASGVAVVDWQIAFRGQGIFDVAYFLSGCLDPVVRRAEEMRLLRLWHGLVTGGRHDYSFEAAVTDYRRAVLYCHVYSVIATGSLSPANERGMKVFRAWLERRGAAIEELDAGDLVPV